MSMTSEERSIPRRWLGSSNGVNQFSLSHKISVQTWVVKKERFCLNQVRACDADNAFEHISERNNCKKWKSMSIRPSPCRESKSEPASDRGSHIDSVPWSFDMRSKLMPSQTLQDGTLRPNCIEGETSSFKLHGYDNKPGKWRGTAKGGLSLVQPTYDPSLVVSRHISKRAINAPRRRMT